MLRLGVETRRIITFHHHHNHLTLLLLLHELLHLRMVSNAGNVDIMNFRDLCDAYLINRIQFLSKSFKNVQVVSSVRYPDLDAINLKLCSVTTVCESTRLVSVNQNGDP